MKIDIKQVNPKEYRSTELDDGKTYFGVSGGAKGDVFLKQPGKHLVNFNHPSTSYDTFDYDLSSFVECEVTLTVEFVR